MIRPVKRDVDTLFGRLGWYVLTIVVGALVSWTTYITVNIYDHDKKNAIQDMRIDAAVTTNASDHTAIIDRIDELKADFKEYAKRIEDKIDKLNTKNSISLK
jgi:hypothetical protein